MANTTVNVPLVSVSSSVKVELDVWLHKYIGRGEGKDYDCQACVYIMIFAKRGELLETIICMIMGYANGEGPSCEKTTAMRESCDMVSDVRETCGRSLQQHFSVG